MLRLWPVQLLLIFLSIVQTTKSQQHSKADFALVRKLHQNSSSTNLKKEENIKVLVKGNIFSIQSIVKSAGGRVMYSSGNIAAVSLPLSEVSSLLADPNIMRIEIGFGKSQPLNDTTVIKNNVAAVHSGELPLPQTYDGTGVIIGFMDTGIDFTHPDFKDANGNTRIKYLWDQNQPNAGNTPQPYNYGQEWTGADIDGGLASSHSDVAYFGHGTHDAGIAAGNGLAVGNYKGMAPNADIIMVAMDLNFNHPQPNADAVSYIFNKAQEIGKPCVISASIGNYQGSHDGKDLEAQLIDNLIKEKNGRVMVASAGNKGDTKFHLGYDVSLDSSFTWFKHNPSLQVPPFINTEGGIYIHIWADTSEFKNVNFSLGADQVTPSFSFRGRLPYSTISDHLDVLVSDTLKNGNNRLGIAYSYAEVIEDTYSLEYIINMDSTDYFWRFITKGSGKFDCWAWGFEDMIADGLPDVGTFPDIARYVLPDENKTMVSSFQCLSSVITVANYTNKKSYYTHTNGLYTDPFAISNEIALSSSKGPTRDERIKPDIAATGDFVISCGVLSLMPSLIANEPNKVGVGGMHIAGGGTSAAGPVVAGIAALFLQKNPEATYQNVIDAIVGTAKQDNFTGSILPNNTWGYGKVNGFSALTNFNSINTSTVSISSICNGETILVPYSATNGNNVGNTMTVELSDSEGSFNFPVSIGVAAGSNSGTIPSIIPLTTEAGKGYRVRVTSSNPYSVGNDNGKNIEVNPKPIASIIGSLSTCDNSPAILSASPDGEYVWSTGESSDIIVVNTSGSYSLGVIDGNGCSDSVSVSVTINNTHFMIEVSGNLSICEGESTQLSVSGASSYSWNPVTNLATVNIDSSVVTIMGDTSTNYAITALINGCDTTVNISLVVDKCLGIKSEEIMSKVMVYPNPFSNFFFVELDEFFFGSMENLSINLFDLMGQQICSFPIGKYVEIIKFPELLSSGTYFYKVNASGTTLANGKLISISN